MTRSKPIAAVRLVAVLLLQLPLAASAPAQSLEDQLWKGLPSQGRPNILLIVADDTTFSDLGFWGSEIPTPNIDALAASGASFSNFNMTPVCSVSRAMFLTGVDAHLIGLGNFAEAPYIPYLHKPGYEGYLNRNVVTIARLLQDAGYHTYMAGKWHLGSQEDNTPHARGFEKTYALMEGGSNHFNARGFLPTAPVATYRQDGKVTTRPVGVYSNELWTEYMIDMIDMNRGDSRPFFAYVSLTATHWPIQAPAGDIERFLGDYDKGWDVLREERFERMKEMGIVEDPDAELAPRHVLNAAWDSLRREDQEVEAKKMAIYAAMVNNMDRYIGRLIEHLKRIGEYDNTVIIFTSDNGAPATSVEGIDSHPSVRKWIDLYFDNSYLSLGSAASMDMISPIWDNAAVVPLGWYKAWLAQGGALSTYRPVNRAIRHRVPFVIRAPGVTQAGSKFDAVAQHTDLAATILDLAKVRRAGRQYQGRPVARMSGTSMVPYLKGQASRVHADDEPLGFELFGCKTLILGDWKITFITTGMFGDAQWHLYHLPTDIDEKVPLEDDEPDRLAKMITVYNIWAKAKNVLPLPVTWSPFSWDRNWTPVRAFEPVE